MPFLSDDEFASKLVEHLCSLKRFIGSDDLWSQAVRMVTELMCVDDVLLVDIDSDLIDPIEHSEGWSPQANILEVVRKAVRVETGFWFERQQEHFDDAANVRSSLAARLDCRGKIIGALYCDIRNSDRCFTEDDGRRLKVLADVLSVYLDDLHSHQKVEQRAVRDDSEPAMDRLLVGDTPVMKALKTEIQRIAALSSTSVLIRGERGCGKEIIASLIHSLSNRKSRELVIVNCASIPKDLFESELFGHEKGAFTGAAVKREGKVKLAEGGTLFLDEIGDTPREFQVKLLRLIQSRTFYCVGSDVPVGPVNVRFLFATNRDLEKATEEGTLREDFYDRITMGRVLSVPPLRERREDIAALARYFAIPQGITYDSIQLLMSLEDWPGNVRQLESVVRAAASLVTGELITRPVIEQELAHRKLTVVTGVSSPIGYAQLRRQYKDSIMNPEQLRDILVSRVRQHRTWSRWQGALVAKQKPR